MDIDKLIQILENPPMKDMEMLAKQIGIELETQCQKDITKLIKRAIDDFYHTYKPKYYKRKYSLKYMFRVNGTRDGSLEIEYGGELSYAHHHESNDTIFDVVFVQGYHGGSPYGVDRPAPGIPYWRTPYPHFTEWGIQAKPDKSPMDRKTEKLNKYKDGRLIELQNEKIKQAYMNWLAQLL